MVADELTGELIDSAAATLVGTGLESETVAGGTFAFPDVPPDTVSLRVQARGYPTVTEEVEIAPGAVHILQILLPNVQAILQGLVMVAKVADAGAWGDARTAADVLALQFPGIRTKTSGIVGRNDAQILRRGVGSISLSSEPSVFLDGVQLSEGLGQAMDVRSHIRATDVKEIKVLRGPASTVTPGSANGAIYVVTKLGRGEADDQGKGSSLLASAGEQARDRHEPSGDREPLPEGSVARAGLRH